MSGSTGGRIQAEHGDFAEFQRQIGVVEADGAGI